MADRFLHYPFRFGAQGGVAVIDDPDQHLRDKVEAVLFTAPGERVNNPDFGVGLNRQVFEGLSDLTIAALEFRISQALRNDMGTDMVVDSIDITSSPVNGVLTINLGFHRKTDQIPQNLVVTV